MERKAQTITYLPNRLNVGLSLLILLFYCVLSVSFAHAQTFGEQLRAAADSLDPEARAEFELMIQDPESMDTILVDMGVPPEISTHLMKYASGARVNAPDVVPENSNRKSYIKRISKRLDKFDDRMNSDRADRLSDAADRAADAADRAADAAERVFEAAEDAADDAEDAAQDAEDAAQDAEDDAQDD